MAAKKKVARKPTRGGKKKTTSKKAAGKSRVFISTPGSAMKLPKGFKVMDAIDESYAPTHDFEAQPELIGKIISINTVPASGKIKKDTRVLVLQTDSGPRTVWDCAKLHAHFDEFQGKKWKGKKVFLRYNGEIKIKGRKQGMKDFTVAVT